MEIHNIPPIYDENSKILILGSFPSVKSRKAGFFYSHPQNRFWPLMARLLGESLPEGREGKRQLLQNAGIALWDVAARCEVAASADSSIEKVTPNDLLPLIKGSQIHRVFTNGGTADRLYRRFCLPETGIPALCLPSTSPANARMKLDDLARVWQVILRD